MIAIHRSALEQAAAHRPAGYLEAVVSKAREGTGGWLWFTEADYAALRTLYSLAAAAGSELAARRQAHCMGCDWLNAAWPGGARCVHPRCGCPRDKLRVRPWENLHCCPAGRW